MSLLLYQELDVLDYKTICEIEKNTLGELKVIRFMKNLRQDRIITKEEEKLLIDWCNGKRTDEVLE